MTTISFAKKFKIITLFLAVVIFLGAFVGCKKPESDNHVVGSQINVVDDIYYEVYIEQGMTESDKGLVVGLHDSAMKILKNADTIYDGQTEVYLINGCIKGLTTKTLGSEDNELKIVKGSKEYTLKYMYVTRAIRNVNDLSLNRDEFPDAPWINPSQHPEGLAKYTPYIFEMDIASLNYSGNVRVPTLKIDGYYVLAGDINVGSSILSAPGQSMTNIIKAGHADYRPSADFLERDDVGFIGTFDGRGHTISNLTTWQGGLFGYINGGTIKNTAFINVCNYWQSPDKHFFTDYANNANFENLYVKLQQQKTDNGSGNYYEYWVNIFGDGTVNVKDCVLESFILEGEEEKNTNYVQFINNNANSTYENVHCVGSSPLAITSMNYSDGVKIMVTEKELQEFDGREYGDVIPYNLDSTASVKYFYVMKATNQTEVHLVEAKAGVEKYDTIAKFNNAMKNDSTLVQSFVQTGCWNFDEATGALTWKIK